jgi:hypothetical protein
MRRRGHSRRLLLLCAVLAGMLVFAGSAFAKVPSNGATEPNGVAIGSPCSLKTKAINDVAKAWILSTLDPKRLHSAKSGLELAPEKMPRVAEFPTNEALNGYIPVTEGEAIASETECVVSASPIEAERSGEEVKLFTPGPYVLEQIEDTVEWKLQKGTSTPKACAGNDKYLTEPDDSELDHPEEEPPPNSNESWQVVGFCNTVHLIQFNVRNGEGECASGQKYDMSEWPQFGYFNQYATGKRLGLPIASDGNEGGNACGPSSLLMAMRLNTARYGFQGGETPQQVGEAVELLPELQFVYDGVMKKTSSEQEPKEENYFAGGEKPVPWLRSQGWSQAEFVGLDEGGLISTNEQNIVAALEKGPVIVSTAFGGARWGKTGGGHIIMLNGLDPKHPGEVDVYDPAGNFFSSPTKHYNARSCGYDVPYPMAWLLAYTTGRYFIKLGPPPSVDPPVISVSDSEPGAASAPETFYLQDPQGHKSGWVDGKQISEIPGTFIGRLDEESYSNPNSGFDEETETFTSLPSLGPGPRTIDVGNPPAGTTLHVQSSSGGTFALNSDYWSGGTVLQKERLSGSTAAGSDTTVSSAALTQAIAASTEQKPGGGETGGESNGGGNTTGTGNTSGGSTSGGSPPSGGSSASSTGGSSPAVASTLSAGSHSEPPTTAQKLAAALKVCKKMKSKSKRRKCEAQAKRKYRSKAPVEKQKKK